MAQPCGATDLAKQNRSIDLGTGFLIAFLNIVEIVMIARIKRKKRIYEYMCFNLNEFISIRLHVWFVKCYSVLDCAVGKLWE